MKVTQQAPAFQPFSITIESPEEATLIATLLGNTKQSTADDIAHGTDVFAMYGALAAIGCKAKHVEITTNKH